MRRVLAALALCGVAVGVGGCGRRSEFAATRRALDRAGYRSVAITVRSGGGVVFATVTARSPGGAGVADTAAEIVWQTLDVRFDRVAIAVAPGVAVLGYDDLAARFGPRDPSLDRPAPAQTNGRVRSELLGVVVLGAVLAGAGLVAGVVLVRRSLRVGRRQLDQTAGPGSELGVAAPSPIAEGSDDDADAMPS
ncbi:MAG TPA: hypothetical protein VHT97_02480 [Acidimicrobiales bacterium]|nr:hypothetical protein [Acidimicrobiales bacterium]